jgi:predicted unusual protein kinase regulating ubiquinone biosynthesis (AarF/ABC1/UbiB family)
MAKKLSRIAKLSSLTSRVSSSYLAQRIKGKFQSDDEEKSHLRKVHLENAQRITQAMGTLKGAAMKVGQSVAVLADSMDLPEDVSKIFSKLHDQAEPIPFEVIKKVLDNEYQGKTDSHFSRIDPIPLGTASLAQAHAAWLPNGKAVVIKVLHEGVENSVGTDLAALKAVLIAGRFLKRSREEIDVIFDEIKSRLLEELDYEKEAHNLRKFHAFFSSNSDIIIPLPVDQLCTNRILVMDRVLGSNLETFLENAKQEEKQKAGDILTYLFHETAYGFRCIHADPHGGNFLFQIDGSIGLIDFGCVKHLPLDFMVNYCKIANATIAGDEDEIIILAKKMGVIVGDSKDAEKAFLEFAAAVKGPFIKDKYTCGVEDDLLMEKVKEAAKNIIKYPEIRSPRDIIFLHRALMGIYLMLCRLQHQGEYENIRSNYMKEVLDIFDGLKEDRGWK